MHVATHIYIYIYIYICGAPPGAGLPELGAKPYKYTGRISRRSGGKRMLKIAFLGFDPVEKV